MLPGIIDPSTQSDAERQLFRVLSLIESPNWTHALHSLNLAEHRWKRVGEIDFLVVGPRGLLVLEVKGGSVAIERGLWRYTNRYGAVTRKKASPFNQASSAMFSLADRLEELVGPHLVNRMVMGYGVVFPDQDFGVESVEWSAEMILDKAQLDRPDGLLRSLNSLGAYWHSKPGGSRGMLAETDIDCLLAALRPDFEEVLTLQKHADAVEVELARLTTDQYGALDAMARNPRILFEGGAGTGKTMLAVELARRASAAGDSVLLTCESPLVAGHIRDQPGLDGVQVCTVSAMPTSTYDVLIVDEAQDIMNVDTLLALDERVKGGLHDGRWYLFLDSNNQRGLVGSFEQEGLDHVLNARPVNWHLNDNCRNTRTIVAAVTERTGADVGVSTAGRGPDVRVLGSSGLRTAGKEIGRVLDELTADGVTASEIMLLSRHELSESAFRALPQRWLRRVDAVDARTWHERPASRLGFARVADFKGMESRWVIAADLDLAVDPGTPSPDTYVAMTRARVGLFLVPASTERIGEPL